MPVGTTTTRPRGQTSGLSRITIHQSEICKAGSVLFTPGFARNTFLQAVEKAVDATNVRLTPERQQPLRTFEEIRADIKALEKETEGLRSEIIGDAR